MSNRTLAPFSEAGFDAADNLLAKAERALADGDTERAQRLITRASALPYDRRQEMAPAAQGASMMLFNAVVDALEDSPEGDSQWLDAAVQALEATDGWGHSELRHVLLIVQREYPIDRSESRTIATATAGPTEHPGLQDVRLPADELAAAVTSVLYAVRAYRAALTP